MADRFRRSLVRELDIIYNGQTAPNPSNWYLILVNQNNVKTFTFVDSDVNIANDTITKTAHELKTGARIRLTTSGTLPTASGGGLTPATDYYVIFNTADTFKLATTLELAEAGTAIDIIAATGGGTHTLTQQNISAADGIGHVVTIELAASAGYARKNVDFSNATFDTGSDLRGETPDIPVTQTASGGSLLFTHAVLLRDASASQGDTTGGEWFFESFGGLQTIPDASTFNFTIAPALANALPTTQGVES